MYNAGDVVVLDFPDVLGVKRRPTIVVSTDVYHWARPDIIVGLVTSNTAAAIGPTDYALQDWGVAGLRLPSAFRALLATIPTARQGVQACLGRTRALPASP